MKPWDVLELDGRRLLVMWTVEEPDYCIVPATIRAYRPLAAWLIQRELRRSSRSPDGGS